MPRHLKISIGILAVLAAIGAFTFPGLRRNVLRLRFTGVSEEEARRAIVQPPLSTPSDTTTKAQLFWISTSSPTDLEATTMELPLSADPGQRARQLIAALIEKAPSAAQRTLPADATLLQFYLLQDGTAIADFSDTLSSETPSGVLSERLAVDSIVRTLGANLSTIYRLKILIRGQETDTLAGHLDLSGFFPVEPLLPAAAPPDASPLQPTTPAAPTAPTSAAPSTAGSSATASTPTTTTPATKPSNGTAPTPQTK